MKRLLALAFATLLTGCDDADTASGRYWYPLPECPEHDLAACDTLTAECQERLLSLAACLYDADTMPSVPIAVVTEAELVEKLDALPADEGSDDVLPYAEQTLVQLQLAKEGDLTGEESTENLVKRLEGVYLDAEQGILIVDRGEPRDSIDSNAILLHEFVHALQDAEYGLDDFQSRVPGTEDAALAARSVIEGQATYLHFRALMAMKGRDVERLDWPLSLDFYKADVLDAAYEDPSPFLAAGVTFPYAYGVALAYSAWRVGGLGFHAKQFSKPPVTTYEIIDGIEGNGKSIDELGFEAPQGTLEAGLTAIHDTALGAFLIELQLRASGATAEGAKALSRAWRGDRLFIYADESDETTWLWELAFASEDAAARFVDRRFAPGVDAQSRGARAFLVGAADAAPEVLVQAGDAFVNE